MTLLSNIVENIERSLYEAIRLEIIDNGYFPDIDDTGTYPDTAVGLTAFKAAIAAIAVSNKHFAIELFGVGSNFNKDAVHVPRIVIQKEQGLPGTLGGSGVLVYTQNGGTYNSDMLPPSTTELYYSIGLIWKTAEQERILTQLLSLALPKHGYIDFVNNPTGIEKIFVRNTGFSAQSYNDKGYVEHSYIYCVSDVFETENIPIAANIAPINEIRVEVRIDDPSQITPDATIIITP